MSSTTETLELADPYLWLEDCDSLESKEWLSVQRSLANDYFSEGASSLQRRAQELVYFDQMGVPVQRGERSFYGLRRAGQNQSALYVQEGEGTAQQIIDVNSLSADGSTSLLGYVVSSTGSRVLYGLSEGGSDWITLSIYDVDKGEHLTDHLEGLKFMLPIWDKSGEAIYYFRFQSEGGQGDLLQSLHVPKLYCHRLGTEQSEDILLYAPPESDAMCWGSFELSDDGRYLFFHMTRGCDDRCGVYRLDLEGPSYPVKELYPRLQHKTRFVCTQGESVVLMTQDGASLGRLVRLHPDYPDQWEELIPESKALLLEAKLFYGRLVLGYLENAWTRLKVFDGDGKFLNEFSLPGKGTVGDVFTMGFRGSSEDPEVYFSYMDFLSPPRILKIDLQKFELETVFQPEVSWDPMDYEVEQHFYSSKDGTRIPLFLVHKRGLKKDGRRRVLLYGYGGFGICVTPSYSSTSQLWLEQGGVLAVANLRGGGEYGRTWHEQGCLGHKQNVFDDFAAAAEYLQREGYCCPETTGIYGRSNGGLLVGASVTQRPELFGAAVAAVGVLDMLRFHKFTIGWTWVSDYGLPEDPVYFDVLRRYSPYHNVCEGAQYPATLVVTGDHDDRVVPLHSYKFAAALQGAQGGSRPIILRVHSQTGHGMGKSRAQECVEAAELVAFLLRELN